MSATISRKLSNSFEGALAGGGDPATSPLYVFGPFLRLIVVAGVAQITFGASVWLAVFTVIMVSMMYRQVMIWVTDGSGGSGLSEEEFGSWAVKINASITIIEYTLTYLVSMAALVTFIADRIPLLNQTIFLDFQYRTFLAIALSLVTAWLVNLGPKISTRVFGPATAAVLLLLWTMVAATIYKTGFHLPDFNWQAFSLSKITFLSENGAQETSSYLHLTFGGYARILALMTGIEIFANLVAAYDGKKAERSGKAFGSLLIIMGTTAVTMLIVGPAIMAHADPLNEHVSVFTQTMDFLLPPSLSYAGTLIGVAVLLSACAAAAQGIQNLSLGLRYRHYISARLGQRNKHDVASAPVWAMMALGCLCFIIFGTREDTYLALYAAGVFILLSMTGWAASKRLLRDLRKNFMIGKAISLIGTIIAALLTTIATFIIFKERFFDGAWCYLIMVPAVYFVLNFYRNRLGAPSPVEDRLGLSVSSQGYLPQIIYNQSTANVVFKKIIVPLNGTTLSEQVLPFARAFARSNHAMLELLTVNDNSEFDQIDQNEYLRILAELSNMDGIPTTYTMLQGKAATRIDEHADKIEADLIIMATRGSTAVEKLTSGSIASQVIQKTLTPMLIIRPTNEWRTRYSSFKNIMIALDGSEAAESVLTYVRIFTNLFQSKILLLSVPEGSESEEYTYTIERYLNGIAEKLRAESLDVETLFMGSGPARTIQVIAQERKIDLIMLASHGRGGIERSRIHIGSVTQKVIGETPCPVFVVPLTKSR